MNRNEELSIGSKTCGLLGQLLESLKEQETEESSFERRFTGALGEIISKMSPRGREIMQMLIQQAAEETHGRLPGLYRYLCDVCLLHASGQSSAPLQVPDVIIDFFQEHSDRPGCLIHCDVCRGCGSLVPFLNLFRENKLVRHFDVCPACGRRL